MAKFKEKLKKLMNTKLFKAIAIIFMCIVGFILLGRCNKVEAANFTLSDGTTSEITYNEGQILINLQTTTVNGVTTSYEQQISIMYNETNNTYVIIRNSTNNYGNMSYYNGCTYDSNIITCSRVYMIFPNVSSSITASTGSMYVPKFIINQNTILEDAQFVDAVFNIKTIYNEDDINNAQEEGYNEGYTNGKEDGYNEGYTAGNTNGYNTGFTEGANSVDITQDNQTAIDNYITENNYHTDSEFNEYGESQYNKGYDDGESAGFTSGANANIEEAYNNGYSYGYNQGYTSGMSDADNRVNTSSQSYIVGFTAGVGSVDITADNGDAIVNYITSNNYHTDTDYLNYGKAQYTSGYNEGQYTMINGIINNAKEKYNTNITNVCSDDKTKCNTYIESTNKTIYDQGYNDRDITTDNYQAVQKYITDNTLYTQKQYDDFGYEKYMEGAETAEGYDIGFNEGYKDGQRSAEVSILDFFPGIIGSIIAFFITLMQISIFGVRIFDIVGILFGFGLVVLIIKVINGGGD